MSRLIDRGSSGPNGSHGLGDWLQCPRRACHGQHEQEELNDKTYLTRGNLLHTGLAHHYIQLAGKEGYLTPEAAVDAYAHNNPSEYNTTWAERIKECLRAYAAHWGDDSIWEVVGVEKKVAFKVRDGDQWLPYTARYDLCVRNKRDGKFYFVDHKGTYAVLPSVVRSYALSLQMLGLQRLGRAKFGKMFGGVILNFVRIPADTDKPCEFKRVPLPAHPKPIKDVVNTIREAHAVRARFADLNPADVPGSYGEACYGKYGPCHLRSYCIGRDEKV